MRQAEEDVKDMSSQCGMRSFSVYCSLPQRSTSFKQEQVISPSVPSSFFALPFVVPSCVWLTVFHSGIRPVSRLVSRPVVRAVGRGVSSSMREAGRGAGRALFSVARRVRRFLLIGFAFLLFIVFLLFVFFIVFIFFIFCDILFSRKADKILGLNRRYIS